MLVANDLIVERAELGENEWRLVVEIPALVGRLRSGFVDDGNGLRRLALLAAEQSREESNWLFGGVRRFRLGNDFEFVGLPAFGERVVRRLWNSFGDARLLRRLAFSGKLLMDLVTS